ncbi:MAG: VOC family protein [Lachnospiraceae bacterium]|nr:VOC family protein [Lachnospiraceae bacterium]
MKMLPDHITINVRDMEKSEDFYGRILGLEKLEDVDMGDHQLHYFRLEGDIMLELIHYDDDFGELHPHVKTRGLYRHLAFRCDDVDALYKKLLEENITVLTPPDYVSKLKFRNILAEDPNGVELEFVTRDTQ